MPQQTPLTRGDVPYPQYAKVSTHFIKNAVAVPKGDIFTQDAAGRLIVPVTTTGVSDLTKGAFQAMEAVVAPVAEDKDRVQCLRQGSRIILKADASLVVGQDVDLDNDGASATDATKVKVSASPRTKGYLGRIFEIYTKGTDGAIKQVTADNDLVIIDLEV